MYGRALAESQRNALKSNRWQGRFSGAQLAGRFGDAFVEIPGRHGYQLMIGLLNFMVYLAGRLTMKGIKGDGPHRN